MMVNRILVMVMMLCVSSLSYAGIVLEDEFESGALDTSKWTQSGGTISFGDGKSSVAGQAIILTSNSSTDRCQLASNEVVSLSAGETAILTITHMDGGDWQQGHRFGFESLDGSSYVTIGTGSSGVYVSVKANGGTAQTKSSVISGQYFEGPITITLSADYAKIESGIWGTYLDTSAAGSESGWLLPSLGTDLNVLFKSGYNTNSMYVEGVQLEIVPEPATLALLGFGCLLALKRRKA